MLAQLTLRTADDNNGDYQTVAVARLRRDSQDCWSLDEDFIPPLLKVLASRWLHEQTEQLTNQLGVRLQRLMAMRGKQRQDGGFCGSGCIAVLAAERA